MAEHTGGYSNGAGRLRQEYWTRFREYMEANSPIGCAQPTRDDWMIHSARLNGGALFSVLRARTQEIGVQYALDDATSYTIYSYLLSQRSELESHFAESPLTWHNPAGQRTCIIEVRRPMDLHAKERWPDSFTWLKTNLELLRKALVPIVGQIPVTGEQRQWTESSFFEHLGHWNPSALPVARGLLNRARNEKWRIRWGKGRQAGSFMPCFVAGALSYSLLTATTAGTLIFRFVDLKPLQPFDTKAQRLDLLRAVNEVRHFDLPDEVIDRRPAVPMHMLSEPRGLDALLEAMERLRFEVKRQPWSSAKVAARPTYERLH